MINGENIIYHYIQKTLLSDKSNDAFNKELIERFIIDLSIWLPKKVYDEIPILLPYVVRDASCRKKQPDTGKHEWGFANEEGFLRDDNSLIKGIVRSFKIKGSRVKEYHNKKLGKGFVASHIWRKLKNNDKLASTFYLTNSFVPNLVWLPKQISKLSDREGSYAQQVLKSLSYKIYFENDKQNDLKKSVWQYLDNPKIEFKYLPEIDKLNYFEVSDEWIKKRKKGLIEEIDRIILTLENNSPTEKKVKCSAYLPTLIKRIKPENKSQFIEWLLRYRNLIKN